MIYSMQEFMHYFFSGAYEERLELMGMFSAESKLKALEILWTIDNPRMSS